MEITAAHPLVQVGSQLDDRQAETDVNLQAGDGRFKDKTPFVCGSIWQPKKENWRVAVLLEAVCNLDVKGICFS